MRTLLAQLFTVVLLLSACGSSTAGDAADGDSATSATQPAAAATGDGDGDPVDTTAEPAEQSGDSVTGDSGANSDAAGDGAPKTLDEYLGTAAGRLRGGGAGAGGFDGDEVLEQQRLVQQEIQRCMQLQGFEYVPESVGDGLRFFLASASEGIAPLDYAETQGFGISTSFDAVLEGDFDFDDAASPNDEHLETLSEGEADAWQFALRGEPPVRNDQGQLIDPDTGEVIQGGRRGPTGGCALEAQQAVRGDFAQLAELADEFEELAERIAADPRIAEIALSWQDCMRSQGHDYQDEGEARQAINQEFRPLLRSFFQGADNGAAGQGGGQGRGGGNQLQRVAGLELTPDQEAELEALQDEERAVAVASISCQGDTATEVEEITARYESEFVEVNRAALEAFSS